MDQGALDKFEEAVISSIKLRGLKLSTEVEKNAELLLSWIDYLRQYEVTGTADELVNGIQAAIVESAGCISLGLARPALFSMRAQVDMLLSWMFFKDHPVEWSQVEEKGKGFKLKSEVIIYLQDYYQDFKSKFAVLLQGSARREGDPYRLLSAHIHSQSSVTIPKIGKLSSLVASEKMCEDCVLIQFEVSEYLSDILLACYSSQWASLPKNVVSAVQGRLTENQFTHVFKR